MASGRGAVAVAAGLVLLSVGGYAVLGAAYHRAFLPAPSARTPAPIIGALPTAPPVPPPEPSPTPVSHEGLRVKVPEIGIDLPIVEGDGYNAPLYRAAHYPGTPWPGEGGRSVIYAHARVGMFGPLFGARVGERIEITRQDGSVRTYIIRQYFPHWSVTDLSWLRPGDHEEVVLITCTTYNYDDPRIIAVGEPPLDGPPGPVSP
jgi:LPXTG-site transpeptidase (sortase) family protein